MEVYLRAYRYICQHLPEFPREHAGIPRSEASQWELQKLLFRKFKDQGLTEEDIADEVSDAVCVYRDKFGHGKPDNKPQPQSI